jgi:Xaa-Pro aminopeptidase
VLQPDYNQRRKRLRQSLRQSAIESALITDATNVTWLTGFTGDSTYLLLNPHGEMLISDSRYEVQLGEECPGLPCEIRTSRINLPEFTVQVLQKVRPRQLALEAHKLSKAAWDQLVDGIPSAAVVPATQLVEPLRAIKDKAEIAIIRESIRIAERAFAVIRNQLTGSQTELQIAHNLEHQIRQFGGTRCSFDPIVGVGPRGALPHGRPSRATVDQSSFLLIDWGAQFHGYASDLTRILVTGKISPKLRKVYNIVLQAQQAAIRLIRPGVPLADIDKAARGLIADAGFARRFGHGLGHGIGLQIHESPFISPVATGTLLAGMVVTVEPGVYLPDWGGIRIEDDVLVTADGCQVLTSLPRELDQCLVDTGSPES